MSFYNLKYNFYYYYLKYYYYFDYFSVKDHCILNMNLFIRIIYLFMMVFYNLNRVNYCFLFCLKLIWNCYEYYY
jgi:hypothetical protein